MNNLRLVHSTSTDGEILGLGQPLKVRPSLKAKISKPVSFVKESLDEIGSEITAMFNSIVNGIEPNEECCLRVVRKQHFFAGK